MNEDKVFKQDDNENRGSAQNEPAHSCFHYYMFHKPYGCVSARRDDRYQTVMDYFRELNNPNLSPVGRLDRETEGLLLITDDGKWNQMLCNPKYGKRKRYEFLVLGELTDEKVNKLETGVRLIGSEKLTAPARVTPTEKMTLAEAKERIHPEVWTKIEKNRPELPVTGGEIIITEGRKNQIRRMMKQVGCCVVVLKRLEMDGIKLDETLQPGQWKELFIVHDLAGDRTPTDTEVPLADEFVKTQHL